MRELDDIVARAPGWRFTLEKGNELVLSPSKTKREGWQGTKIRESLSILISHLPQTYVLYQECLS